MKLGKTVLLEIVAIVQESLLESKDASDGLREIDVDPTTLELSDEYIQAHPRAGFWKEN